MKDSSWINEAACRQPGVDRGIFLGPISNSDSYPTRQEDIEAARSVCISTTEALGCPVVEQCLADGKRRGDFTTFRGGFTGAERMAQREDRKLPEIGQIDQPHLEAYAGISFNTAVDRLIPYKPMNPQIIYQEADFWEEQHNLASFTPQRPYLATQALCLQQTLSQQAQRAESIGDIDDEAGQLWYVFCAGAMALSRLTRLTMAATELGDSDLDASGIHIDHAPVDPRKTGLHVAERILAKLDITPPEFDEYSWYRTDGLYLQVSRPAHPSRRFYASHEYNEQQFKPETKFSITARIASELWWQAPPDET